MCKNIRSGWLEYSIFRREPEKQIIPTTEESGIGLMLFSLPGKGFLTCAINAETKFDATDLSYVVPCFSEKNPKVDQKLVELLSTAAASKEATPAKIALGWLLAQKPLIVPIPGTTQLHRLTENIGGTAVDLSADDVKTIDEAFAATDVPGDRYPSHLQKLLINNN